MIGIKPEIDLHVHTTASDGSLSPDNVVKLAADNNLSAIAICDHDSVDGINDAMAAGKKYGVEVIPGIEISVKGSRIEHILGYFLPELWSISCSKIYEVLLNLKKKREERNKIILEKLNVNRIDIDYKDVQSEAGGKIISRLHFAAAMVKKGYEKAISDVFAKHIGIGCYAYEPKETLTAEEAIYYINGAYGVSVLAHPYSLRLTGSELFIYIEKLKRYGISGIEAYYWEYDENQTDFLLEIADKLNLLVTSGSDFHGLFRSESKLGLGRGNLKADYSYLKKLKDLIRLKYNSFQAENFDVIPNRIQE